MKDRIKQIIDYENISHGKFADLVGIERSGVSHLISGRNNPSLDVIQKILEAFDYINTDWLLLGKGDMIKAEKKEVQRKLFTQNAENKDNIIKKNSTPENNSISLKNSTEDTDVKKIIDSPEDKFSEKKIVKIVIFYSDKTFSDYVPE